MRDILIKAVDARNEIYKILGMIDRTLLQKGQLLINSSMLEIIVKALVGDELEIKSAGFGGDGSIRLTAATSGGMELEYAFMLERLEIGNQTIDMLATYTEARKGGGIGGALLGLTGKSGLSFALSKHDWIQADSSTIRVYARNLPDFLRCLLIRVTPRGIYLRVY
jgi:hypothetical protein